MNNYNNPSDINQTFIIEPQSLTGGTPVLSGCTAVYSDALISCSGNTVILLSSGETIFNTSIIPVIDANIDIGSQSRRFRDINTISGTSSVWLSTASITTPILDLGVDSSGDARQITANNSVIQNDTLFGGTY